jgi:hypothetical protein
MRTTAILSAVWALATAGVARAEWAVGLRTTAQHLRADEDRGHEIDLAGGGVQVRWRFLRAWSAEITLEGLRGEIGDDVAREGSLVTLTFAWHVMPGSPWDLYLLAGVGGARSEVTFESRGGAEVTQELEEGHVSLGIGLERRFGPVGIGVEVRAVGQGRNDDEDAAPHDAVPPGSVGGQGSVTASWYF